MGGSMLHPPRQRMCAARRLLDHKRHETASPGDVRAAAADSAPCMPGVRVVSGRAGLRHVPQLRAARLPDGLVGGAHAAVQRSAATDFAPVMRPSRTMAIATANGTTSVSMN